MKNHKKLKLKKLSIAKLDAYLLNQTLKGGTDGNSENCLTHEFNCQTSVKTNTEFSVDFDLNCPDPNFTDPNRSCACA